MRGIWRTNFCSLCSRARFPLFYPVKNLAKTRDFIHVFDIIMWECEQLTPLITDLVFDKLHLTRHIQTEAACHRLDLRPLNVFDCTGKWNLETSQMDQINRLPRAGFSLFLLTFVHKCDVICWHYGEVRAVPWTCQHPFSDSELICSCHWQQVLMQSAIYTISLSVTNILLDSGDVFWFSTDRCNCGTHARDNGCSAQCTPWWHHLQHLCC